MEKMTSRAFNPSRPLEMLFWPVRMQRTISLAPLVKGL